jgi:hypothetical protein
MARVHTMLVAAMVLAMPGCGKRIVEAPRRPPAARPPAYQPPVFGAQPVAPINRGLGAGEMLWHLRAGLTVAAIACRGGRTVAPAYNRMLALHRTSLANANREETARFGANPAGVRNRDIHETRLYNFFSNPDGRAELCNGARRLLQQVNAMESGRLAAAAPRLLAELEAAVR